MSLYAQIATQEHLTLQKFGLESFTLEGLHRIVYWNATEKSLLFHEIIRLYLDPWQDRLRKSKAQQNYLTIDYLNTHDKVFHAVLLEEQNTTYRDYFYRLFQERSLRLHQ